MNTVAIKAPQIVDTQPEIMRDKLYAVIQASWIRIKRLSWLFERHPGFIEQNLLDKHMGIEVRRLGL